MKTREEAEKRALELFPNELCRVKLHYSRRFFRMKLRDAFIQCWDEMQQDKQTCGFCVNKNHYI